MELALCLYVSLVVGRQRKKRNIRLSLSKPEPKIKPEPKAQWCSKSVSKYMSMVKSDPAQADALRAKDKVNSYVKCTKYRLAL